MCIRDREKKLLLLKGKYDPIQHWKAEQCDQQQQHSRVRKLSETANQILSKSFDEDLDKKQGRRHHQLGPKEKEDQGKLRERHMEELHFSGLPGFDRGIYV